ncbi:MAG: hypothetical protein MJZ64_06110, partial [Paludibacteraceae bacterium]|nr:hypothetical protein [Paludibacteraceae bacterium]
MHCASCIVNRHRALSTVNYQLSNNLLNRHHILSFLLLGLLPGSLLYAASCPVDSVITYDQNNEPIAKTIYAYDEAGRTILEQSQRFTEGVVTSGTKTETSYYSNGKTQSTATWKWSTTTDNWIGNEKNVYTYNAKGSTLTWEIYNWGANDWAKKTKYEYAYDDKNRQILSVYYTGNGTQWTPKTKQENGYDSKGNKILDRYYSGYDAATGQWIGSSWQAWEYNSTTTPKNPTLTEQYTWENGNWKGTSRYDYEYDTYGNQTLSRYYNTYDASTQTWFPSSENHYAYFNGDKNMRTLLEQYTWKDGEKTGVAKEEYAYDAGGNLTMTTIYQWDTTAKTFIPISKLQIEYDEWDNEIYHEEYAIQNGKWVGITKEEHTYTDKTYLTEEIIYQWDASANNGEGDFVGKSWAQYTYDQWKNKNSILQYTWNKDGSYWKGIQKEEYTFNAKAQKILSVIYQWDDTNRRWLGNSKSIYEFDAANHLILEEQYTWSLDPANPDGGYWQGTKKEEFGYNAANQQTKAVTYEWSTAINDWIGKTKVLSDYDSNKNQTLNEQYTWTIDASPEGGYWHGTIKEEYTFNKNKQQTSSLIYVWNDTRRDWDYVSKTKSEYDTRKNLTLDERYEWQNDAWVGTLKKEYAYNAQGQQTMFAYYAWNKAKGAFVGTQKEETELDAEGRTV